MTSEIKASRDWLQKRRTERVANLGEVIEQNKVEDRSAEMDTLEKAIEEEEAKFLNLTSQLEAAKEKKSEAEQMEAQEAYAAKTGDSRAEKRLQEAAVQFQKATADERHFAAALSACEKRRAELGQQLAGEQRRIDQKRFAGLVDRLSESFGRIQATELNLVEELDGLGRLSAEMSEVSRRLENRVDFHRLIFRNVRQNLNWRLRPFYNLGDMPCHAAFRRPLVEIGKELVESWQGIAKESKEVA